MATTDSIVVQAQVDVLKQQTRDNIWMVSVDLRGDWAADTRFEDVVAVQKGTDPGNKGSNTVSFQTPVHLSRRRSLAFMFASIFSGACAAKPRTVTLNVVLFSYLSRPIFDVYLGSVDIGAAGKYPSSGRAIMAGVELAMGAHVVSWRLDGRGYADSGTTVEAANQVAIENVPSDARYVGVHIYPDNAVELTYSRYIPHLSKRGEAFDLEWRRTNG